MVSLVYEECEERCYTGLYGLVGGGTGRGTGLKEGPSNVLKEVVGEQEVIHVVVVLSERRG